MKHTTRRLIERVCAGAFMLSLASLAAAQTVSQPPPNSPAAAAAAGAPAQPPPPPPLPKLTDEQASYLFGLTFGEQLHSIGANGDHSDAIERGIKDALQGKKSTQEEKKQVQEYARSLMTASAERNKAAAADFLKANGAKKGVQTTASGLQYKVIKAGDAKAAPIVASDEVTVNYRGKLIDGTEFDSSYSRGVPASFPVGGVIKGWQEALVLMKPGANYELYVPPDLAYGSNPRPGIPANSLLIFNVDVLSVKPKEAAPAAKTPAPQPPKAMPMPPKTATPQ